MSSQDWLQLELQNDGVMLVTMQNSSVNAFNPKSLGELEALFGKLASDDATKAVVLASELKVFSAGLNLKEAQYYDLAAQQAIVDGFHKTFLEIFEFPKPFIVAVEGAAIAGGFFPYYLLRLPHCRTTCDIWFGRSSCWSWNASRSDGNYSLDVISQRFAPHLAKWCSNHSQCCDTSRDSGRIGPSLRCIGAGNKSCTRLCSNTSKSICNGKISKSSACY